MTLDDLIKIREDFRANRGLTSFANHVWGRRVYSEAGLNLGPIDDALMQEAIDSMRRALVYDERGDDLYDPLLHDTKKIAETDFSDTQKPIVRDFYRTMVVVARGRGDPWLLASSKAVLRGRTMDDYNGRMQDRIDSKGMREFCKRVSKNIFDPVRRKRTLDTVREFLDKYKDFSFDLAKYREEQVRQIDEYLSGGETK